MINEEIVQEILHQLFSALEALETQSMATLQFLKDKGIADEEELRSHVEQAGNASSVRWRAARVRIDHLLASAVKATQQEAPNSEHLKSSHDKNAPSAEETGETSPDKKVDRSSKEESEQENRGGAKVADRDESETRWVHQVSDGSENNRSPENDKTGNKSASAANNRSERNPNEKIA